MKKKARLYLETNQIGYDNMIQWLFIGFFFIAMVLMAVADQADKDDYKSGKQKKTYGSRGPYRWKEPGDNERNFGAFLIVLFILLIVLTGWLASLGF